MNGNPLTDLQPALLSKLASLAVHADEFTAPGGHDVDRQAIRALLADPQVKGWLDDMTRLALAPLKRS